MKNYKLLFIFLAFCLFFPKQSFSATGEDTTVPMWPIFYYKSEGEKSKADVMWPIYSYRFNGETNEKAIIVRPFLYSFERRIFTNNDNQEGKAGIEYHIESKAFLTLYKSVKSPVSSYHRLFPIYSFKKNKLENRKRILTYGSGFETYEHRDNKRKEYRYLWPLYGKSLLKDKDGNHTYKSGSYLWPIIRYGNSLVSDEGYVSVLWPLIEARRYGDGYKRQFLPFYLSKQRSGVNQFFVFPWYSFKSEDTVAKAIFPLWYRKNILTGDGNIKSSKEVLLPFYYKEKSEDLKRLFVLPGYFSETTPLVRKRAIIPIWFNSKSEKKQSNLVLPFYFKYNSEGKYSSALLPFYVNYINKEKQTQFKYYFPFYGYQKYKDVKISNYFMFPLYRSYNNEEAGVKGLYVLWPLYHQFKSKKSEVLSVVPFYFYRKDDKRELKFVLPAYYRFSNEKRELGGVFPFYYDSELYGKYKKKNIMFLYSSEMGIDKDYKKQQALFGLYYNYRGQNHKTVRVFPVYYFEKRGDDFKTANLWPLYGSRYVKNKDMVSKRKYWLWPILSVGSKEYENRALNEKWVSLVDFSTTGKGLYGSKTSISKKENHLFPIYRYINDKENGNKSFALLWRVYRYIKTDQRKLIEFNFLYYNEKVKNRSSYWSVLGGLYGVKTDKNGEKDSQILWFF